MACRLGKKSAPDRRCDIGKGQSDEHDEAGEHSGDNEMTLLCSSYIQRGSATQNAPKLTIFR